MNLNIIRHTKFFTDVEFQDIVDSVKFYAPLINEKWNLGGVTVSAGLTDTTSWNIYLTDDKRNNSALGFHTIENGLPCAYISPSMNRISALFTSRRSANIYGQVIQHPALVYNHPEIKIGSKVFRKAYTTVIRPAKPTEIKPGFISVVTHEVAEMMVDPFIDRWTPMIKTPEVPNGGELLIEVGDHVNSSHFTQLVNNKVAVMADATIPSFYDPNGVKPLSLNSSPTAPLTFPHGTYAYIKDAITNARIMQFAQAGDTRK